MQHAMFVVILNPLCNVTSRSSSSRLRYTVRKCVMILPNETDVYPQFKRNHCHHSMNKWKKDSNHAVAVWLTVNGDQVINMIILWFYLVVVCSLQENTLLCNKNINWYSAPTLSSNLYFPKWALHVGCKYGGVTIIAFLLTSLFMIVWSVLKNGLSVTDEYSAPWVSIQC